MGNKVANDLLIELGKTTPSEEIKHRKQSTGNGKFIKLSYVDARFCMDRLDEVVGPAYWKKDYKLIGATLYCGVSILVGEEWVTKWDCGSENTFEKEKSLASDSFKRACVCWGIARDLYSNKRSDSQVTSPKADNNAPIVGGASTSGASQSNTVGFGKHAGNEWAKVPLDYVEWVASNMKDPAKSQADAELRRRATQAENVH